MLPAKFGSIWPRSFRGGDLFSIRQSETRIALLLKQSSPLKLLGQMEPNLAESIYVRSSIKFLRFVPLGQQIWLPRAILVSDCLMLNKSLTVANQKKKLLLVAMFVGQMEPNEEAL
jgi:hypothetical protein